MRNQDHTIGVASEAGPIPLAFRRFAASTSGATTPEYILVASVVLCAVLSIGSVIGNQTKSLHALAADMSAPREVSKDVSTREVVEPAVRPLDAQELATSPTVLIVVMANLAMIGLIVTSLLFRRRRRRRARPEMAPELHERWSEHASRLLRMLRQNCGGLSDWELLVDAAMSRDVATVRPNARLHAIQQAMHQSPHGLVVVAETNGRLLGVIREETLADPTRTVASKLMDEPLTLDSRTSVSTAIQTLIQSGCHAMPVTANGSVCGVLSHVEVALALQATLQMLREIEIQHRQALLRTVAPD